MIGSQISFAGGPMLFNTGKILYHTQNVLQATLFSIPITTSERLGCLRMQNKVLRTPKILILQGKYWVFGLMKQIWLITGKTPTKYHWHAEWEQYNTPWPYGLESNYIWVTHLIFHVVRLLSQIVIFLCYYQLFVLMKNILPLHHPYYVWVIIIHRYRRGWIPQSRCMPRNNKTSFLQGQNKLCRLIW